MNKTFLSIGDTTLDTFLELEHDEARIVCTLNKENCQLCLHYADKIPVKSRHETLGGNAANAAITGARLGLPTSIWTQMGEDDVADIAQKEFKKDGVDLKYFERNPKVHSNQSTIINYGGERTILVYGDKREFKLPELGEFDYIYLTSLGDGSQEILFDIAKHTSKTNAKLIYQPGSIELSLGADKSKEILENCYILVMNKEEAFTYAQNQNSKLKSQNDGMAELQLDIRNLLKSLLDYGPKIAIITDGKNGSYVSDGQKMYSMGIDESVPMIERTGAGDAYASAFSVAMAQDKDIPEAMRWGAENSAGVIQKIGPQAGILTQEEMETEVAKDKPELEIKTTIL